MGPERRKCLIQTHLARARTLGEGPTGPPAHNRVVLLDRQGRGISSPVSGLMRMPSVIPVPGGAPITSHVHSRSELF